MWLLPEVVGAGLIILKEHFFLAAAGLEVTVHQ
jgi:hypothetical protein